MEHKLGFIGLGMMGLPMARRILKTGAALSVYNRTRQKAEGILAEGARWCESPSAVASRSDIVFTMVANPDALREVTTGPSGILPALKAGGIHIDTSTVSPAITRTLTGRYGERGCFFLHAPVLGSVPQASDGTLLMFVGGNNEAYRTADPYLKALSRQIWKFDRPEQATHLKLLCNLFIAGMITTLGQALIFAKKADVDQRTLLEVIGQSQVSSPMYERKGTSIIEDNFAPRFYLEHMLKDINLMMDAADEAGAPLPAIRVAQQLFEEASRAGFGREDYSAVVKALEMMKGK
jgi:3-hydroxyisobutyrate dehydrogenase